MRFAVISHDIRLAPSRNWLQVTTIFKAETQGGAASLTKTQIVEMPIPKGVTWPRGKRIVMEVGRGRR